MLREAVKNSTNLGLWFNLRGEGLVVPNPLNIPDSFQGGTRPIFWDETETGKLDL